MALSAGTRLGPYEIISSIGAGGMGVVYRARDLRLDRQVAIKLLPAEMAADPHARERLRREAMAAAALDHPYICKIFEIGEDNDTLFLVMEYIAGQTLHRRLVDGRMSLPDVLRVAGEIAEALQEAHAGRILHRDLKPDNIMLTQQGHVKVMDFGLAKRIEDAARPADDATVQMQGQLTAPGTILGTPDYMSPEQIKGQALDERSDLFSFGVILAEMISGRHPFRKPSMMETMAAVLRETPEMNGDIPQGLILVLRRTLAKDAADRYASITDMRADLARLADSGEAVADEKPGSGRIPSIGRDVELQQLLPAEIPEAGLVVASPPIHESHLRIAWRSLRTLAGTGRRSRTSAALALAVLVMAALAVWWLLPGGGYQATPEAVRWYREGVAAMRDGTYYKASMALEQAVRNDSTFTMAHARLAEAWMEMDFTAKARDEMLRATPPGSHPRLTRAEQSYVNALHLTLTGNFAGAVEKYRDIVSRTSGAEQANAWLDLGRAYERNEKLKEALDSYTEASQRQSQNPAAWLRLAILYVRQRDPDKAAGAFGKAEQIYRGLSNFEGVTEVLYQRAVLANRLGKSSDARAALAQALELSRHTGSLSQQILALLQLSAYECRVNNFTQAQADATEAIDLARVNGLENLTTRGLVDLGNAYFLKGDGEEARKYFEQSLEYARRYRSDRNESRALLSLGSLEMSRGQTDEGLRNVQQAMAWYVRGGYQKETAQALILIARAQRQKGDYAAALQSFEQQLEIGRKLGDSAQIALAEQGMGTVLQAQGHLPRALSRYQQAYEAARKTGDQLNAENDILDASEALWQLGHYDQARQLLEQCGSSTSRTVLALADQIRGAMALSQRQFPVAIETSRRLLSQKGLGADLEARIRSVLGRAQAAAGARREGVASTEEAVSLATKSGSPWLIAETRRAHAETLLAAGEDRRALQAAQFAQQWFARAGNQEAEWHCWLVESLAEVRLAEPAKSREAAQKAAALLADLRQKWDDPGNYNKYLNRPDVQFERNQLDKLVAGR